MNLFVDCEYASLPSMIDRLIVELEDDKFNYIDIRLINDDIITIYNAEDISLTFDDGYCIEVNCDEKGSIIYSQFINYDYIISIYVDYIKSNNAKDSSTDVESDISEEELIDNEFNNVDWTGNRIQF